MINFHITRQTYDFDCGAKALQTVMAYYGVDVREDKLLGELGTGGNGTQIHKMVAVAEKNGFQVIAKSNFTISEIKGYIDGGVPVIVLLQAWAERYMTLKDWREDNADGHYAIVIGYKKKTIIFEDPASFRRVWLKEHEFLSRWHDYDDAQNEYYSHFGMVLLGKEPANRNYIHMD